METNIAHLGLNFWRKLAFETLGRDAFLLCLNDDGDLLMQFPLASGNEDGSSVMGARVQMAISIGTASLVRIQRQPASHLDPFGRHSFSTRALYDTAHLYGLPLTEVIVYAR